MFINPLFLENTTGLENLNLSKPKKAGGSGYLFSDIINVFMNPEDSEGIKLTQEFLGSENLKNKDASPFILNLLNQKEFEFDSEKIFANLKDLLKGISAEESKSLENLISEKSVLLNKGDLKQLLEKIEAALTTTPEQIAANDLNVDVEKSIELLEVNDGFKIVVEVGDKVLSINVTKAQNEELSNNSEQQFNVKITSIADSSILQSNLNNQTASNADPDQLNLINFDDEFSSNAKKEGKAVIKLLTFNNNEKIETKPNDQKVDVKTSDPKTNLLNNVTQESKSENVQEVIKNTTKDSNVNVETKVNVENQNKEQVLDSNKATLKQSELVNDKNIIDKNAKTESSNKNVVIENSKPNNANTNSSIQLGEEVKTESKKPIESTNTKVNDNIKATVAETKTNSNGLKESANVKEVVENTNAKVTHDTNSTDDKIKSINNSDKASAIVKEVVENKKDSEKLYTTKEFKEFTKEEVKSNNEAIKNKINNNSSNTENKIATKEEVLLANKLKNKEVIIEKSVDNKSDVNTKSNVENVVKSAEKNINAKDITSKDQHVTEEKTNLNSDKKIEEQKVTVVNELEKVQKDSEKFNVKVKKAVKNVNSVKAENTASTETKSAEKEVTGEKENKQNFNSSSSNKENLSGGLGERQNQQSEEFKQSFTEVNKTQSSSIKEKATMDQPLPNNHAERVVKTTEIMKEIGKFIQKQDTNTITLKVDPESLGKLKITIDMTDQAVKANIVVESDAVKTIVENNLNDLTNQLSRNGVQVSSVNVTLSEGEQKQNKGNINKKKDEKLDKKDSNIEDIEEERKKDLGYNTVEYLA